MAILMPPKKERKSGPWATVGTIAGGVIGGVASAGNPAAISAGMGIGGSVGGVAEGIQKKDALAATNSGLQATQGSLSASQLPTEDSSDAIARRLESHQRLQEMAQLEQGISALPELPPDQRQMYEPRLLDAYGRLKKGYA